MNNAVFVIVFIIFSIGSVIEDVRSFRVRPWELGIGILFILTVKFLVSREFLLDALVGGTVGAGSFLVVKRFSKGRLGDGDLWFSALVGSAFGFWTWDLGVLAGAFLGVLWVGILRISGRRPSLRDIRIPFLPFMFAGALAVAVYRGLSS